MYCLNCKKETNNPKFCGSSCAAIYNNHHFPKRKKKKWYCKYCGKPTKNRNTTCNLHNHNKIDWSKITLKDMISKRSYQVYSRIRELARNQFKNQQLSCRICGYDKHVEIHHIKPISSFPVDTTISVINCKENLDFLCPNHHWEIDNGYIW